MKIEKLNFLMQKRSLYDPEYDFNKGVQDKINEIIDCINNQADKAEKSRESLLKSCEILETYMRNK